MNDVLSKLNTTYSPAGMNWQKLIVVACTTAEINISLVEVLSAALPKASQWCNTVTVERCVQIERPVCLKDLRVWFAATDSNCRDKPLIFKTSALGEGIEIDECEPVARMILEGEDTCCFSRMQELFFTLLIGNQEGVILARAQGSLIIEANAARKVLLPILRDFQ